MNTTVLHYHSWSDGLVPAAGRKPPTSFFFFLSFETVDYVSEKREEDLNHDSLFTHITVTHSYSCMMCFLHFRGCLWVKAFCVELKEQLLKELRCRHTIRGKPQASTTKVGHILYVTAQR